MTTNNLFEGTIELNGNIIETRVVDQNVYSFGRTHEMNKVTLGRRARRNGQVEGSFGEAVAFLNALQDLMDGVYAVVVPGFHAKVSFEMLFTKLDDDEVMCVNFDALTDEGIIAKLAAKGIAADGEHHGWTYLKTSKNAPGRLFWSHGINPLNAEELKAKAAAAGATDLSKWYENNNKAWAQFHKQNAVYLAKILADGFLRVVIAHESDVNMEWQDRVLEEKFRDLFGSKETRREKRAATIAKREAQKFAKQGAWLFNHNVQMQADAEEAVAGGITVFVAGEERTVDATELIKARVRYWFGDQPTRRIVYFSTLETVKSSVLYAQTNGFRIFVEDGLK